MDFIHRGISPRHAPVWVANGGPRPVPLRVRVDHWAVYGVLGATAVGLGGLGAHALRARLRG